MDAIDVINRIFENKNLSNYEFRYCLVDENKLPYTCEDELARINDKRDFGDIFDLIFHSKSLSKYKGLGVSIQESKICAIDVDKCFSIPFELDSADDRAIYVLENFMDKAYIEFSFSGTGLRVFFKTDDIENYSDKYYVKNKDTNCEYYQPSNSARYVTITAMTIVDNDLNEKEGIRESLFGFLDKYMLKPNKVLKKENTKEINENKTFEQLKIEIKKRYLKDSVFQDKWFSTPSGSNGNESETDFYLISYIYDNVTHDKEMIKKLFESSPYFSKKDSKHINKWNYGNNRYYEYVYNNIKER